MQCTHTTNEVGTVRPISNASILIGLTPSSVNCIKSESEKYVKESKDYIYDKAGIACPNWNLSEEEKDFL